MRRNTVLLLLVVSSFAADKSTPVQSESIEMFSVLFSQCSKPAPASGLKDPPPVRFVYASVHRDGDQAQGSIQWTVEQFETARSKFVRAGIRDGQVMALSESSGDDLPISFLKLRTPGFNFEAYTMYLRFRWSGEMKAPDEVTGAALNEWQILVCDAILKTPMKRGIGAIEQIADDCAKDWPSAVRMRICDEARQIIRPKGAR